MVLKRFLFQTGRRPLSSLLNSSSLSNFHPPTIDDSVERGVVGMHVELALIDGSMLNGSIFPEVRMGRPRLVDILNDTKQPFIALFGADRLQIVNRALIAHARPLT